VDIAQVSWNQICEYIAKWYGVLRGSFVASSLALKVNEPVRLSITGEDMNLGS